MEGATQRHPGAARRRFTGRRRSSAQHTFQRAWQKFLDLQERIRPWEERYGCNYILFAYRTSTEEDTTRQLEVLIPAGLRKYAYYVQRGSEVIIAYDDVLDLRAPQLKVQG